MKVRDITAIIEEVAPLKYAEDFDNVGLLVGSYKQDVTGILITLDTLENVVDEAIKKGCNLIVSFHPIIFSGLKKLNGNNYVEKVVLKAIKNDIAIYAMHTALDNVKTGVNGKICEILGIENTKILLPKKEQLKKLTTYIPKENHQQVRQALFDAGAGNIGNYSNCTFNISGTGTFMANDKANPVIGSKGELMQEEEIYVSTIFESHLEEKIIAALKRAHPYEEVAYEVVQITNTNQDVGMGMIGTLKIPMNSEAFLNHLKNTMKCGGIRHSKPLEKTIKKVAVLGGSGSFAIGAAIASGADAYVTADIKYHEFYKAEGKLLITDIGHYESEQYTKNLLFDLLTKKISTFAPALLTGKIIISEANTNPIYYT
ncbi:Nif3-like dinuclear metal center hexameric protein [Urechidicola sp. KH5]